MEERGKKRIMCSGLICLDIVTVCKDFPKEDTDIRTTAMHWQKGGNAANTSAVLGMLGDAIDFFGSFAIDDEDIASDLKWKFIKTQMENCGVNMDCAVCKKDGILPISIAIINSSNGLRTILHHNLNYCELTLLDFNKLDLKLYSWIHFEGRNVKEVEGMMAKVVQYNSDHPDQSITISVELEKPKRVNLETLLPHANVVIISREFAESKGCSSAIEAVVMFKTLTAPGTHIICAWGATGAASGTTGVEDDVTLTPAVSPERVVDTLGAGDTFLAGIIHALHSGKSLTTSVQFACALAGHKVGSLGYECVRTFKSVS